MARQTGLMAVVDRLDEAVGRAPHEAEVIAHRCWQPAPGERVWTDDPGACNERVGGNRAS